MKFDDWLFNLLLSAQLGDNPDAYIRRQAVDYKDQLKRKRRGDAVTFRVLNRLIKSPAPAVLLRGTLTEVHFSHD
jgi:hypothetical protein